MQDHVYANEKKILIVPVLKVVEVSFWAVCVQFQYYFQDVHRYEEPVSLPDVETDQCHIDEHDHVV